MNGANGRRAAANNGGEDKRPTEKQRPIFFLCTVDLANSSFFGCPWLDARSNTSAGTRALALPTPSKFARACVLACVSHRKNSSGLVRS